MLGESYERQLQQLFMSFSVASKSEEFSKFITPAAFKTLVGLAATNGQDITTNVLADRVQNASAVPLPAQEKEVLSSAANEFAGEILNNKGSELYTPNAASTFPSSSDIVVLEALRPIKPAEQSSNPDETSEDNDDDDDMDLDINDEMME